MGNQTLLVRLLKNIFQISLPPENTTNTKAETVDPDVCSWNDSGQVSVDSKWLTDTKKQH